MDYYLCEISKFCITGMFRESWRLLDNYYSIFFILYFVEAAKLSSYMHFREPFRLQKKTLLEKADLDKAIDFMDVIEEDIPKGERNSFRIRVVFSCIGNSQRCLYNTQSKFGWLLNCNCKLIR